jgi:peptide-methionine (S)-S-oxide reductase
MIIADIRETATLAGGCFWYTEAVRINFDPADITFADLLDIFWRIHDPTTFNRQGADFGTRYRSAIFYHDQRQRKIALASRAAAEAARIWPGPVVTGIMPAAELYPAEEYHRRYYEYNWMQGY